MPAVLLELRVGASNSQPDGGKGSEVRRVSRDEQVSLKIGFSFQAKEQNLQRHRERKKNNRAPSGTGRCVPVRLGHDICWQEWQRIHGTGHLYGTGHLCSLRTWNFVLQEACKDFGECSR